MALPFSIGKHLVLGSGLGLTAISSLVLPINFSKSGGGDSQKKEVQEVFNESSQTDTQSSLVQEIENRVASRGETLSAQKTEELRALSPESGIESITLPIEHKQIPKQKVSLDLQKSMSYLDFAKTWGIMGFRREAGDNTKAFMDYEWFKNNYTNFKGNPPSVIHAWEKFFDLNELVIQRYGGNLFFKEMDLPFYSKSLPFVLVEFPSELSFLKEITAETIDDYRQQGKWQKLNDIGNDKLDSQSLNVIYDSHEHSNKEKLKKFLNLSKSLESSEEGKDNSDLYAVQWPRRLLRRWLRDWDKWEQLEDDSKIEDLEYFPFELQYQDLSEIEQGLKANVLKRWYKGKSYRMWIFNKPIKSSVNSQKIYDYGSNSRLKKEISDHDIHWSDNFLKNIMVWYWYSYKPGHMNDLIYKNDKYIYSNQEWLREYMNNKWMLDSVRKIETEWNLLDIFRNYNMHNYNLNIFKDRIYAESMPLWIKAWFTGEGRQGNDYWRTNYSWFEEKANALHLNRVDRIKWVSEALKLQDWGVLLDN